MSFSKVLFLAAGLFALQASAVEFHQADNPPEYLEIERGLDGLEMNEMLIAKENALNAVTDDWEWEQESDGLSSEFISSDECKKFVAEQEVFFKSMFSELRRRDALSAVAKSCGAIADAAEFDADFQAAHALPEVQAEAAAQAAIAIKTVCSNMGNGVNDLKRLIMAFILRSIMG
jgi:hypothetical protein